MTATPSPPSDVFIQQLTGSQSSLRAIIMASLGNHADCEDVLQATNLVIWKKASEFDPTRPFLAWASGIARIEVLTFIRDRKRDRLAFREDVAELLIDVAEVAAESIPQRQIALRHCLQQLPMESRELLNLKYVRSQSTKQLSAATGRSLDGVKSVLVRIRRLLSECVENKTKAMPEA
ncbi:sigma-70 family RNA polymerase sigma factor [Bremerella sp. P1]|uniref:sigma-70 family RNA polymerase sigma factor n=1 Tax=Bremerella sp. P1 TaxID=3026424 RepID=UPI002368DCDB|nr:sigma-70 family RNA polymerase sigma factor [Bremerella sp. P1]WDI43754.1 sigma-70 family RNA polymerase sigma factor [Bremerella sp. P1]